MKIRMLLFAAAKELAKTDCVDLTLPDSATLTDAQMQLLKQFPQLQSMGPSLLWAVNNQYSNSSCALRDADTVACFPPVSGG